MTQPIAILVDDEPDIRELLAISLKRMGIDSIQAGSFTEGLHLINATECNLCITDVRMPDGSGLELVKRFKALYPDTPIAVMTAFDTTDIAIQAMKAGAFDFLAKPIRAKRLETLIEDMQLIVGEAKSSQAETLSKTLIGISESMSNLRDAAAKASQSMAPVLIQGEPGTGKELVARSIHNQSLRKFGPFVSIDCGAIPHDVLESEFFGHEKDSFPEAHRTKKGLIQAAKGGSLLLNEVSKLPAHFQVKLLRSLDDRMSTPLGSETSEPVDVRVFATANESLDKGVQSGVMREDFYYYLNVIGLSVPTLRERPEDIEPICDSFLNKLSPDQKVTLTPEAAEALRDYGYPGNVRELENVLRRSQAMCANGEILKSDLQFLSSPKDANDDENEVQNPLEIGDLEKYLDKVERKIISATLEAEKWNRTRAAKRLNLTPRQFRYKLSKHRLNDD